ncbi:MAG: ATP-binding cassette domain-containing protein [Gemmobacter sp.]
MAPLVEVRAVSKRFPGVLALSDVSLDLRAGEVHAVIGENAAGKSTLMNILAGALQPDSGTLLLDGAPVRIPTPQAARALGTAVVFQELSLCPNMTVAENIVSASLARFTRMGWLQRRRVRATAGDDARRLDARIAGLTQRMGTLSGGNQQKVILARGLVTAPRVLILHEPTRGIDVGAKAEIYDILKGLATDGLAVLMISSELPEIVMHSSPVIVMADGAITADLRGAAIAEESVMQAATGTNRHAAE